MPGRGERLTAGALRIRTFEGSRPEFGRAIAYWGFNRNRATKCGKSATHTMIGDIAVPGPIGDMAVALPNGSTRSVRRSAASFKRAWLRESRLRTRRYSSCEVPVTETRFRSSSSMDTCAATAPPTNVDDSPRTASGQVGLRYPGWDAHDFLPSSDRACRAFLPMCLPGWQNLGHWQRRPSGTSSRIAPGGK